MFSLEEATRAMLGVNTLNVPQPRPRLQPSAPGTMPPGLLGRAHPLAGHLSTFAPQYLGNPAQTPASNFRDDQRQRIDAENRRLEKIWAWARERSGGDPAMESLLAARALQHGGPLETNEERVAEGARGAFDIVTGTGAAGRAIDAMMAGAGNRLRSFLRPNQPGSLGATAYHGSPHRFDQFELSPRTSHTGEGVQMYGHGLYFAEEPGVGSWYVDQTLEAQPAEVWTASKWLDEYAGNPSAAAKGIREQLRPRNEKELADYMDRLHVNREGARKLIGPDIDDAEELEAAAEILDGLNKESAKGFMAGHLYEVDIADDAVSRMLDWDAPLSEQPKAVKDAFKRAAESNPEDMLANVAYAASAKLTDAFDHMDGNALYRKAQELLGGSQEEASRVFRDMGIPGLRYLDAASRPMDAPATTRNIVVFDDSIVKTLKRNDEPLGAK